MQQFNKIDCFLADETATQNIAIQFAKALEVSQSYQKGLIVYLKGDLGAGKSFFSRALIQHFLPEVKVKSPTYTLVESYNIPSKFTFQHFDLYRLCEPDELEFLGLRELLTPPSVALVEWPSKGEGFLPEADLQIELVHPEQQMGRNIRLQACSALGQAVVENLTV